MDTQKVDLFVMLNSKYFESYDLPPIRERILNMDDSQSGMLSMLQFKDPTTMLLVSLIGGGLGIDRFMIGDTGVGLAKLLTCGGLGIWTIVDWFLIQSVAREKNRMKLLTALGGI